MWTDLDTTGFPTERRLSRDQRQEMIASWAEVAFGRGEATSLPQRGLRLLEEAIEAFQACGGDEAKAHELVAYVFGRDKGEIGQELGGVAVCTLALAAAAGLSADEEEAREIHRVLSKPIAEFTARNAAKNAAGFLVDGTPIHDLPALNADGTAARGWGGNSCCGKTGTRREGSREYCAACGAEVQS
jgi:NTP pyrophosphatase (non-canonical NTP hydrolase)